MKGRLRASVDEEIKKAAIRNILKGIEPTISFLTDFESQGQGGSVYRMKSATDTAYRRHGERLPLILRAFDQPLKQRDISHGIPLGNILCGAHVLQVSLTEKTEPSETVYVAVVDPGVGTDRRPIVVKTKTGKVLLGPDNGLLSLVFGEEGVAEARVIENRKLALVEDGRSSTFDGKDVFGPGASSVVRGISLENFGPKIDPDTLIRLDIKSEAREKCRKGNVLSICDTGGNLRTSMPNHFESDAYGRRTTVRIYDSETKREIVLTAPLVRAFAEVPVGSAFVIGASAGCMDVGFRERSASKELGIPPEEVRLVRTDDPQEAIRPKLTIEIELS